MNKILSFLLSSACCFAGFSSPIRDDLAAHHFTFPQEDAIVPIDYIESTGTQYLNLLFKKSDVPDIVIEVRFSKCAFATSYTYFNGLLGWCEGSNGYSTGLKVASNGIWLRDGRNASGTTILEMPPPVDIVARLSSTGAKVNGVEVPTYQMSLSYGTVNFPCGLFCFSSSVDCEPKGASTGRGIGRGRCHYLRVYSGDTLVHYFQPVRIGSTGFMLDTITGALFANQGTGDFLLGHDL